MKRFAWIVLILALGGAALSLASGVWSQALDSDIATGKPKQRVPESADDRGAALAKARRGCTVAGIDAFIDEQRERTQQPNASATDWRVLAESYLERALTRSVCRGMAIGKPIYKTLPAELRQDLDLGEAALARARELGDASSESYRIEAALSTGRITGLVSAVRVDSKERSALEAAARIDPSNPRVTVALACRKLFRPFGGDPAGACSDLLAAADAMPLDERPLVLASMAALLAGEKEQALEHARRAAKANPDNPYAQAVCRRLEAGEADPFGRDVEATR